MVYLVLASIVTMAAGIAATGYSGTYTAGAGLFWKILGLAMILSVPLAIAHSRGVAGGPDLPEGGPGEVRRPGVGMLFPTCLLFSAITVAVASLTLLVWKALSRVAVVASPSWRETCLNAFVLHHLVWFLVVDLFLAFHIFTRAGQDIKPQSRAGTLAKMALALGIAVPLITAYSSSPRVWDWAIWDKLYWHSLWYVEQLIA